MKKPVFPKRLVSSFICIFAAAPAILFSTGCASTAPHPSGDKKASAPQQDTSLFMTINGRDFSTDVMSGLRAVYFSWPCSDATFPSAVGDVYSAVMAELAYPIAKAAVNLDSIRTSQEWQILSVFYPGQLYFKDELIPTLGLPDSLLKAEYEKNKKTRYFSVKKIDSTKTDTTILTFKDARPQIAMAIIADNPKPDSTFYSQFKKPTAKPGEFTIDTALAKKRWPDQYRRDIGVTILKQKCKAAYGVLPPDSFSGYSSGPAAIPAERVNELINWIPADRRQGFSSPAKKKELCDWLLRWKLFSAEAKKTGYSDKPQIVAALDWAWKFEVVKVWLNTKVKPGALAAAKVDTLMSLYNYWDKSGKPMLVPDTATLAKTIAADKAATADIQISKTMYDIRSKASVKFYKKNLTDGQDVSIDSISKSADSLNAAGAYDQALQSYEKLNQLFPFSKKGSEALVEIAKLATEREDFYKASESYRKYLRFGSDTTKRNNIFFMLGFIYGEHLHHAEMADACYKWVLKNAPDCELADDAEFMCQHIAEPMTGVEELQSEAKRQGKQTDTDKTKK